MSSQHPHSPKTAGSSSEMASKAALENFTRLQESQQEYLQWLETVSKKPEVDRYIYKKIR